MSELIECRIFAVDLRCHGDSTTSDDYDLSVERQVDDIVMIYSKYFGDEVDVPTFLIGHRFDFNVFFFRTFANLFCCQLTSDFFFHAACQRFLCPSNYRCENIVSDLPSFIGYEGIKIFTVGTILVLFSSLDLGY